MHQLTVLIIAIVLTYSVPSQAFEPILSEQGLTHITFKKIAPNNYQFKDGTINIDVDKSASFLLLPFKDIRVVNKVSFLWKKTGQINSSDAEFEESRSGDDAYMRIGLMLKGNEKWLNPMAPGWIKKVRETMHLPSEMMIYLVAGSQHKPGEYWKSPFSNDVGIIAADDITTDDGWLLSQHEFKSPLDIVGLWIMADGDNTASSFSTSIKSLILESIEENTSMNGELLDNSY